MTSNKSLLLNEDVLGKLPEPRRSIFIYEWLQSLIKVLPKCTKEEIKTNQKRIVEQIMSQVQHGSPGPPVRKSLAVAMTTLFTVGDAFLLFDTINKCNDILKSKEDSPSILNNKLAATVMAGVMYERLGRMMGRSYEETVQALTKSLKSAESQSRAETMVTLGMVCKGLGNAAGNVHREIYKSCKTYLTDRVMNVRIAAAGCLMDMMEHATFLYTSEFENLSSLCIRALDGASYLARLSVAKLLGLLIGHSLGGVNRRVGMLYSMSAPPTNKSTKSVEEALGVLVQGFLRGGVGSFLKGSTPSTEIRVGIAHSFVFCFKYLGQPWIEKHLPIMISQVSELVTSLKHGSSHLEIISSRKAIYFILSAVVGRLLRENVQLDVCKELILSLQKSKNSCEQGSTDTSLESNEHWQVCALQQIGFISKKLSTSVKTLLSETSLKFMDTLFGFLVSPSFSVQLSAAACLKDVCTSSPSSLTPHIDKCMEALEKHKTVPEAINGYSYGLASLLSAANLTPNGIPHTRGKIVFNVGEELLRSASQNSRISKDRTRAGWILIASIMSLGSSCVKGLLPRCMLLWRNAFPKSPKDLESEKARGDAFTWLISLEARAGALASMRSFIVSCDELLSEDILRRLEVPLEAALNLLTFFSGQDSPLKAYSGQLKLPLALVKHRFLEVLSVLPKNTLENSYAPLLRILVSEITMSDSLNGPNATSLLSDLLTPTERILLGSESVDDLNNIIEGQLGSNTAVGASTLEHDSTYLFRTKSDLEHHPLPITTALIDASIIVFGRIYPRVANKHKFQMIKHFKECIRTAKANKIEALQLNIYGSILTGLKGIVEEKYSLSEMELINSAREMVDSALTSQNCLLRCIAAECLGRLAQVIGNDQITADMAQKSIDNPKSATDVASRTGHSLALGCLHKYIGGLASSQHLQPSISILLPLSQDSASPAVQAWALHALALLAESGGPMFRSFVEPTLTSILKLLLTTQSAHSDVLLCISKLLQAIITTLGPELSVQDAGVSTARSNVLIAIHIMQNGENDIQSESILSWQQLQMFAPCEVDLKDLVPKLVKYLQSNDLKLRRAAASCLRQLSHKESKQISEIVSECNVGVKDTHHVENIMAYSESGLPGILFSALDQEDDKFVIRDCQETLLCLLGSIDSKNLSSWIVLCKEILTTCSGAAEDNQEEEKETDDDDAVFTKGDDSSNQAILKPRWATQVFATQCLNKIISQCCQGHRAHFDLALAKEVVMNGGNAGLLVLHLAELMRMAFMAATSVSDPVKIHGLETLRVIIDKFAETEEPEFPGHVRLEQYQALVGAALRPAFSSDTPSHITAKACAVCSTWLNSGVVRDMADLKRVYQLLVTCLSKLKKGTSSSCYNENASTLEKLSILQAWAEVYIVSMKTKQPDKDFGFDDEFEDKDFGDFAGSGDNKENDSLSSLVTAELPSLSKYWLGAMKDYALLSLPKEFKSQLPYEGGAFYTNDTIELSRPHYKNTWAPILHASCLWITEENQCQDQVDNSEDSKLCENNNLENENKSIEGLRESRFHLLTGICLESLCNPRSTELSRPQVLYCLSALEALLMGKCTRALMAGDSGILIELCNVLHRQALTQDSSLAQAKIISVISMVSQAAAEKLSEKKLAKQKELDCDIDSKTNEAKIIHVANIGEGGENGKLSNENSIAFAILEVCLCVLVQYYPDISPRATQSSSVIAMQARSRAKLSNRMKLCQDQSDLINICIKTVGSIMYLCSPAGAVALAPSVLYLVTSVLQASAHHTPPTDDQTVSSLPIVLATQESLQTLVSIRFPNFPEAQSNYNKIVQSGILRILDAAKSSIEEANRLDELTVLLAIKVYLLFAPIQTLNTSIVKYPILNIFCNVLQHSDVKVRRQCIKILHQIYRTQDRPEISTPFIQSTAPIIIRTLLRPEVKKVDTADQLLLHSDCLETLEILIVKSHPDKRMLDIYIPILVNLLLEDPASAAPNDIKQHEMALARLTRLGNKFGEDLKRVVGEQPELKRRMEQAILHSKQQILMKQARQNQQQVINQPSITLRTDFSNFT